MVEDNQRKIRTNIELEKLYKDANIGTFLASNASDGWVVYNGRGKKQQENTLRQLTTRTTQGENQG